MGTKWDDRGIRFYQRLEGQNLLISDTVIAAFVAGLAIQPDCDVILEIGAGTGNLTCPLAATGARVIAIEKDPHLYVHLRDRCQVYSNVTPVFADFFLTPEMWYPAFTQMPAASKIACNFPFAYAESILSRLVFVPFKMMVCLLGDKQIERIRHSVPELYGAYVFEPLRAVEACDCFPRQEMLTGTGEEQSMRIWRVARVGSR